MVKKTSSPLDSISKSYHDTFEIFVGSFGKFFGVIVVPALISTLLGVAFIGTFLGSVVLSVQNGELPQEGLWVGVMVILTILVVQILGICALYYMTIHHQKISVLKAFEDSIAYFFRFIGYGLLFLLVSAVGIGLGSLVLGLVAGLILGASSGSPEVASLSWLSIIPTIGSAALTSLIIFTGFSIVDKNNSLAKGMRHSYRLVRAHYTPVVVRLALFYTVIGILTFLLTQLPVVGNLLSLLVLTPFTAIYLSVLYRDLAKQNAT